MKLRKTFGSLFLVALMLVGSMTLVSCGRTSVDEDIEDAAERTGAAFKDLGDAAGDAVDDAADAID
tara:strand:+ start:319 stop:516 length:198 start_codon:yes stop_codon:yes gene_type:complete